MKGDATNIPALEITTLNSLISKIPKAPSLLFSNMFSSTKYPSDTIEWEIEYGSAGMTPFVAEGALAPVVGVDGFGKASAKAAYLKEKMFFDAQFLNAMRLPGTSATYATAESKLAKGVQKLDYRLQRRLEWMAAKMFLDGGFTYSIEGGARFTVNYGVPASHRITLTGDDRWNVTSVDSDPIGDIFEAKKILVNDSGSVTEYAICNTELLQVLMRKTSFQTLLAKSQFGNGDLFSNPSGVIGTLLGVGPLKIYDDIYEIPAWITQNVSIGASSVFVDEPQDFEVGATIRLTNMSTNRGWEDRVISGVNMSTGEITFTGATTLDYVANRDRVTMRKKYIADNQFCLLSTKAEGRPVAEFMEAPYGIPRTWGKFSDKDYEWDPAGVWLRIQHKTLPVLYNPDTTVVLNVY